MTNVYKVKIGVLNKHNRICKAFTKSIRAESIRDVEIHAGLDLPKQQVILTIEQLPTKHKTLEESINS